MDERAVPRQGRSGRARRERHGGTQLKVSAARVLIEGQQVVRVVRLVEQWIELLRYHVHRPIVQGDIVQRHP